MENIQWYRKTRGRNSPAMHLQRITMNEPVFSEIIPELMISHFRHLNEGSGISAGVIREVLGCSLDDLYDRAPPSDNGKEQGG